MSDISGDQQVTLLSLVDLFNFPCSEKVRKGVFVVLIVAAGVPARPARPGPLPRAPPWLRRCPRAGGGHLPAEVRFYLHHLGVQVHDGSV